MAVVSCSQTLAGLAKDCQPSMGGVRRVLAINYSDVGSITAEAGVISAIELESQSKFSEYRFQPDTAYFTTTQTRDNVAGTNFWVTEISMTFKRMDSQKRAEMMALGVNDLALIVEDMNGKYWYFGKDEPVMATGGESGTGTARADANKYGITFQDNAKELPYEVQASIIANLINPPVL